MRKALFGAIAVIICASAAVQAQPYQMTLAGASPGGLWSQLGVGVNLAVGAAYPGSTITYQTSGGGLANIPLVSRGQVPMGIALDTEVDMALKGEEPYTAPIKDVRMLARLYDAQINYNLVTKEFADKHGIRTLADIVAKKPPLRVAMNRRGNATGKISALILDAVGITPQEVERWGGQVIYAASAEQANLMQDRRIDMIANGLFVPDRSVLQITNSVNVVWLDTPREVAEKVAKDTAGKTFVVKAGAYPWLDRDILTTAHGAVIVVSEKMDDKTASNLAKALIDNVDKVKGGSAALASLNKEMVASPSVVAFHPAAERVFREAGLLK